MALTLDSTLQARLDTIERQPEIELSSGSFAETLPFQGNSFGITGSDTFRPQMLYQSTGRLGKMYINDAKQLIWMYTDVDRNQWTSINLGYAGSNRAGDVAVTELSDGNIGVIIINNHYGAYSLYGGTISPTGTIVTTFSQIENLSNSYDWRAPFVTRLSNGTYYLVYVREDPDTTWTIYARTATTWGTWGSASDITPSGVTAGWEIDNTSLYETTDGDLFLLFDHVTVVQDASQIYNIFSSISTNYGATWGTAEARTSYTEFGSSGLDPIIVQKSSGTAWLIFYERVNVLWMDETATGWLQGCNSNYEFGVKDIHLDSNNGKVIVAYGNSQVGPKQLCGIAVIDIATWSIDKIYHKTSTPALNSLFTDGTHSHIWYHHGMHGEDNYWAGYCEYPATGQHYGCDVVVVLDHVSDTLIHYVIDDTSVTGYGDYDGLPSYNLPANVHYDSGAYGNVYRIKPECIRIDSDRQRLYIGWSGGYFRQALFFSYIDLTATPDGQGFYSMTWITSETDGVTVPGQNRAWFETAWAFEIDKERNYFICYTSSAGLSASWPGGMVVLSENADGAIVKYFTQDNNNTIPYWGPHQACIYDGVLYGSFYYRSAWPYTDQRGLVRVDYVNDNISFHRPDWVTTDQYWFYDFSIDETNNRIYMGTAYGVARYDIGSGSWTLFNSDTVEGWVPDGKDDAMPFVQYDSVTGNIIAGAWNDWALDYHPLIMFNESGPYYQLQYINGDKTGGGWVWSGQENLSYYTNERNPTAAVDSDDTLWVVWNNVDWQDSQQVLYWDNDGGAINIINNLVGPVTIQWRLKRVNQLDFTLANGQLYDPQNLLSTRRIVGGKGRKVTVRIGENIDGYTYWVNQGTYIVNTVNMDYTRGKMPMLRVSCTGRTSLWKDQQIPVSALYSGEMPDDLLIDLIGDRTAWTSNEYDIPVFDNEHSIYYQWVDKTLWDVVEEIADHFFYAMYEDVDGVFTLRPVSLTQAVDHEYTDSTHLLNFGPDDSFSDYTNQVRVIGESNDYTEVLHNEELITSKSGTVGWWVKKLDEKIYFSEDGSRQCRNPQLVVLHSPKEYGFLLDQLATGDGGVELSYIDPYEKYVKVEIRVKDLTIALAGAIAAMLIIGIASLTCTLYCGAYIWALAIAISLIFYILAAVAQYQYEIYARPLGRVKNTIQYEANDLEFQRELNGEIVTQEITDALCYSITECRRVAEGELQMVRAQRSRLAFKKLAHLQDELLDKIKVYHVYSAEPMEVFVVGLKRTYEKGKGVFDDIQGWRYIP